MTFNHECAPLVHVHVWVQNYKSTCRWLICKHQSALHSLPDTKMLQFIKMATPFSCSLKLNIFLLAELLSQTHNASIWTVDKLNRLSLPSFTCHPCECNPQWWSPCGLGGSVWRHKCTSPGVGGRSVAKGNTARSCCGWGSTGKWSVGWSAAFRPVAHGTCTARWSNWDHRWEGRLVLHPSQCPWSGEYPRRHSVQTKSSQREKRSGGKRPRGTRRLCWKGNKKM